MPTLRFLTTLLILWVCPPASAGGAVPIIDSLNARTRALLPVAPDSALLAARTAHGYLDPTTAPVAAGESHLLYGRSLAALGIYPAAVAALEEALQHYERAGAAGRPGKAATLNALGTISYLGELNAEAERYHRAALALYRTLDDLSGQARTLGLLGHYFEKQQAYDTALVLQHEALELCLRTADTFALSEIYGHLGSIYEDLGRNADALTYFERALALNETTGQLTSRTVHLNNIGDIHRRLGHFDRALAYSWRALRLSRTLHQPYEEHDAHRDLANTYATHGQPALALAHLDSAYRLYRSIYRERTAEQLAQQQAYYDLREKDLRIAALEERHRLDWQLRVALAGGLLLLLLLAGVVFSRQRLRLRLSRNDRELAAARLRNAHLNEERLRSELAARSQQLSAHALHLVQKNRTLAELKNKLKHLQRQDTDAAGKLHQLIHRIDSTTQFDRDWATFNEHFVQLHPDFYAELSRQHPQLTANELRLCALLRLNLPSRSVAAISGVSPDSLRVARYRLRKKIGVADAKSLQCYLLGL
ncbi:MAG: tetratricopeptide repeat protein [Bacteroidota bacterium]